MREKVTDILALFSLGMLFGYYSFLMQCPDNNESPNKFIFYYIEKMICESPLLKILIGIVSLFLIYLAIKKTLNGK